MPANLRSFCLADFDFDLPEALIAQHPTAVPSASRLLDGRDDGIVDRAFRDLPQLLQTDDLLIFNDTRVIKARLFGRKATGGRVEALVERVLPGQQVWAHLRASKSPQAGSTLEFAHDVHAAAGFIAIVLGRGGGDGSLFHLQFPDDPYTLLDAHGHVPLPPYITHADSDDDERRYQSIFAARPGAVAAPTASLHFDTQVLDALLTRGVRTARITLHVGAGTFQPVRSERIEDHHMHTEWFDVPQATVDAVAQARERGSHVVAVGTTTLRALEAAAQGGQLQAGPQETDIFITPGYEFRVVDRLITNFHLPKSTLLMLVSAFAGFEHIRKLYAHAIVDGYRFFSYGDAMLLSRQPLL